MEGGDRSAIADADVPKVGRITTEGVVTSMIFQTLQEGTKARDARKVQIINLGLEPWEALEMGLEVETIDAW